MLKIWGRRNSSNVRKVLWCAEEIGLPYESIEVGGAFGGTQSAEYLAMNPNGLVPVIEDHGLPVWESNAIVRYLSARYALDVLYPADPIVRARSGQVVVIGGLLENRNPNNDANIPWASKLPIVGGLFQQQRKALQQTELVILMRPQVIDDQVWLDELRRSAESFRQVR